MHGLSPLETSFHGNHGKHSWLSPLGLAQLGEAAVTLKCSMWHQCGSFGLNNLRFGGSEMEQPWGVLLF